MPSADGTDDIKCLRVTLVRELLYGYIEY